MTQPIRVMIVDDHDIVRRGLSMFLDGFDDLILVAEAATGGDAARLCREIQPHVVLMDMMLPDTDGISLTRTIRSENPDIQVVMLTSSKDENLVHRALQAGAIGYMLKNVSVTDMVNTIRMAHVGKPTLAPEAAQALINLAVQPPPTPVIYSLTERERTILKLIVDGLSNQQIADEIFVSRATVKAQVSTILSKLGVQNRIEAVRLAVQQTLVE